MNIISRTFEHPASTGPNRYTRSVLFSLAEDSRRADFAYSILSMSLAEMDAPSARLITDAAGTPDLARLLRGEPFEYWLRCRLTASPVYSYQGYLQPRTPTDTPVPITLVRVLYEFASGVTPEAIRPTRLSNLVQQIGKRTRSLR